MISSREVAKLAGVSQATVSRVLNGATNVRKETKEKVEKAIAELHYRPNMIARSLVMKKTKTIALISGDLENPFYSEITTAIINLATKKGYNTMVYFDNQPNREEIYEHIVSNNVAGIIQSSINIDEPMYDFFSESGTPYIQINRKHKKAGNYVILNNVKAGKIAMDHLLQLGHKQIGMIMGPTNVSTFLERQEGCFQALCERGIEIDQRYLKIVDTSAKETEMAMYDLLSIQPQPTAVLCATDQIALTAMDVSLKMGKCIPEDISLIGFDDIALASHQAIQLTSVAHNIHQMGEIAVNSLIHIIEGNIQQGNYQQIKLEPHLAVRKTTSKPSY
ncbi:LacI family DNA-binding transcriptional regulator [Alkalihalobacterium elongatum]|uniref:LacI family DNA-binding transcriptional regulator n=1 Tax=Alkalihalobacterium elongatum TaxID=2675466 RepID=UPI001C2005C1|nr:LacI family DNA-binding transcriptional regulator [Alkalihalobacterium elongatum]